MLNIRPFLTLLCLRWDGRTFRGKQAPVDSADNMRGYSGKCANTCWSKVAGLSSEIGVSAVPAWLLMAFPRLVNIWRMFQLCWATWRVPSKTNKGRFGGGVVWVMSSLTVCR